MSQLRGWCRRCGSPVTLRKTRWVHNTGSAFFGCLARWIVNDGFNSQNQNDYALAGSSKGTP
ncbi:hypothetical protein [Arthrobacter sp. Soil763]|uniref:hypothetical protein n=1 Tax=Arthrobacter sp. Soil763 TaxID=1736402 RepID=UPI0006F1F73D|nr:hypothetical protein [Arthrobacter sp. Soil763]KRE79969.1 hypothetical protein ASG71_08005 [Arthrobacter sp. Soil763]